MLSSYYSSVVRFVTLLYAEIQLFAGDSRRQNVRCFASVGKVLFKLSLIGSIMID